MHPLRSPTGSTALVGPIQVVEDASFPGCSNWSGPADYCTCETWEPTFTDCCRTAMEDGDRITMFAFGKAFYEDSDPENPDDWEWTALYVHVAACPAGRESR